MADQRYTIIVVPHTRSNLRKCQISTRLISYALISLAVHLSGSRWCVDSLCETQSGSAELRFATKAKSGIAIKLGTFAAFDTKAESQTFVSYRSFQ